MIFYLTCVDQNRHGKVLRLVSELDVLVQLGLLIIKVDVLSSVTYFDWILVFELYVVRQH